MRITPVWHGTAVVVGQNPVGEALAARISELGCAVEVLDARGGGEQLVADLEAIWQRNPAPHLFLVTPHDEGASTTWDWPQQRRRAGLEAPFWLCQRWLSLVKKSELMDRASLIGVTRLGGDFGFDAPVSAAESGALSGLLKSMCIEAWVAGHRSVPVKILDAGPQEPPSQIAERVLRELANPSYDKEIGQLDGERTVSWAYPQVAPAATRSLSGNWICTGGARGITAYVAAELGARFGLKLHLIGRAPLPTVSPQRAALWPEKRRELRLEVMEEARTLGVNPIRYCEDLEKALEIASSLKLLRERGVEAHYYSCDLADRQALAATLQEIRAHGPIEGVLHGAGVSRDAKFEQKEPARVEECFRAKIDGTLALMELTSSDPLRFFAAFGSISGRFGANGHADYSLANDMLAKLVGWYRGQRPDVAAVTMHWHAWGDVGMAVKGETQLGLKLIDMELMPAHEGLSHLVAELQAGAPHSEILITTPRYYRQFFHGDALPQANGARPLLGEGDETDLDPQHEVFLREHLMQDKPVLPLAVSLQFLWEAARLPGQGAFTMSQVQAASALKFFDAQPKTVRVWATPVEGGISTRLTCAIRTRSGELVDGQRLVASAVVELCHQAPPSPPLPPADLPEAAWEPIHYLDRGADMYHGPTFRAMRGFYWDGDELWGRITAPSLLELSGPRRGLEGWRIPSVVVDSCQHAAGVLLWLRVKEVQSVPLQIGRLWLGRLPAAGENCLVRVKLREVAASQAVFDYQLIGAAGDLLLQAEGLSMGWFAHKSAALR